MYQVQRLIEECFDSSIFFRHLSHLAQVAARAEGATSSCQHNGARTALARFTEGCAKFTPHRDVQRIERFGAVERNQRDLFAHFQL
jgi:hypothetical protein